MRVSLSSLWSRFSLVYQLAESILSTSRMRCRFARSSSLCRMEFFIRFVRASCFLLYCFKFIASCMLSFTQAVRRIKARRSIRWYSSSSNLPSHVSATHRVQVQLVLLLRIELRAPLARVLCVTVVLQLLVVGWAILVLRPVQREALDELSTLEPCSLARQHQIVIAMENQYKLVKDPFALIKHLGLPEDPYLTQPVEPDLEQALLYAKAMQRTGEPE